MIAQDTIREMVERIVQFFDPEKVILFGSYATSEATEDSDVDLMVVAETELGPWERAPAVRRVLRDYRVPKDIIFDTPQEFRRRSGVVNTIEYFAVKYGRVLHERGTR